MAHANSIQVSASLDLLIALTNPYIALRFNMVHGNCHHIWKLDIGSKAAERKVILDHRALNFLNFSGIEPSHNLESLEPGHSLEELEPGHSLEVRHSLEVLGLRHDLEVLEPTLELSFPELTGKPVLVGPTYTQHRLVEPAFDSHT